MGFADTARAQQLLAELGIDASRSRSRAPDATARPDRVLLHALAAAADPGPGARRPWPGWRRMPSCGEALRADQGLRDRLISVLGASAALGDHLARHPGDWRLLASDTPFPDKMWRGS